MIKILAILLGIGILLFIILTILCAMVLAGRADKGNNEIEAENQKPERNVSLCPKCKVGQESYALDKQSEACPHLASWKTGKCSYFIPIEPSERAGKR